jgi:hypothetical protein
MCLVVGACAKSTYNPTYVYSLDEPGPRVEAMRLPPKAVDGVVVECRIFARWDRLEAVVELRNETGRPILAGEGGLDLPQVSKDVLMAAVGTPWDSHHYMYQHRSELRPLAAGGRSVSVVGLEANPGDRDELSQLHAKAYAEGIAVPFWCVGVWWPSVEPESRPILHAAKEITVGPVPLCAITPESPRWVPCPQLDPPAPEPDASPAP